MSDVYKPYQIKASDLKTTNKGSSGKKKDLVEASSRKFTALLDDEPRVMSISAL